MLKIFNFFILVSLLASPAFSLGVTITGKPPENIPYLLYPHGNLFPFSLYSVGIDDLPHLKEDGFSAVGPYYGDQERPDRPVLECARIAGLKTFYKIGFEKTSFPMTHTDEEIRKEIFRQVSQVVDHTEIAWWYLYPEERRWWRLDEMRYMKVAYEAIKDADPKSRPVWMYEPANRTTESLLKTGLYQDICGKGGYVNRAGYWDNRIWIRWSMEQVMGAVKGADNPKTPIVVLDMSQDAEPGREHLIHSWTRHDAYLSLVIGAKGIMVWSGSRRREGFENHFDNYYDGYASVAKELNGALGLGKVFLFGERCSDIEVEVLSGPQELELEIKEDSFTYPSVASAEIVYGDERYLFLVNSANEEVTVQVDGLPAGTAFRRTLFDGADEEASGDTFEITLPSLGVQGFVFRGDD